MKQASVCYARYWRNHLADTELQGGSFDPDDLVKVPVEEWLRGQLSPASVKTVFGRLSKNAKGGKSSNAAAAPTASLLAYASIYRRQSGNGGAYRHGRRVTDGCPLIFSAVMVRAAVTREGVLRMDGGPYIARSLMDPDPNSTFYIATIGAFDEYLATADWPLDSVWSDRMAWCAELEDSVCRIPDIEVQGYQRVSDSIYLNVFDANSTGFTAGLMAAYDALASDNPDVPLYDTYCCGQPAVPAHVVPPASSTIAKRLGHMEPRYPLAVAQRDALSAAVHIVDGQVLAVTGPPGTGKTTLLQSVIASLWVDAAVRGEAWPPVVLAASTNNQAVTNVIDSFGKVREVEGDPFAGRWIPDVDSYGCYYPAESKLEEARERGYQLEETWRKLETSAYLDRAEKTYLNAATAALRKNNDKPPYTAIKDVLADLTESLQGAKTRLDSAVTYWGAYQKALRDVAKALGADPDKALDGLRDERTAAAHEVDVLVALAKKIKQYLASESLLLAIFSFIGTVRRKRLAAAMLALDIDDTDTWRVSSVQELEDEIGRRTANVKSHWRERNDAIDAAVKLLATANNARKTWQAAGLGAETLEAFDIIADTQIRQPLFKLATHYWEGRWLIETRLLDPDEATRRGRRALEPRWRRRAMLTPCAVSTLYRVPTLFSASVKLEADDGWRRVPLYNFIDLLIIDEGGQVHPALAGPAFAVAKRAIVVGDTRQLPPIQTSTSHADRSNFSESGIPSAYEDAEKQGRTAHEGSTMRVAQSVCRYHYDPEMDRGMMLYEHRRCLDDIIDFCSKTYYGGKLVPKRGNVLTDMPQSAVVPPPLGYLHVAGVSEAPPGGSRINEAEVAEVIRFVLSWQNDLLAAYPGKPLDEIVAIVTPFSKQAALLDTALEEAGLPGLPTGTVYRLQGAEFPIVLFSSVYTRHDRGRYMLDDVRFTLNVAISRAQDSFILIGDMDAFEERGSQPSACLMAHLLSRGAPVPSAADSGSGGGLATDASVVVPTATATDRVTMLRTQTAHDAFLSAAIARAERSIVIVSPWISGSVIEFSGLLAGPIKGAVQRGVQIVVYTDAANHADSTGPRRENSERAYADLVAAGVDVRFVYRIHNKDVFVDDDEMCRGSFNWLSVFRGQTPTAGAAQLDASVHYLGPGVKLEKRCMLAILEDRRIHGIVSNQFTRKGHRAAPASRGIESTVAIRAASQDL